MWVTACLQDNTVAAFTEHRSSHHRPNPLLSRQETRSSLQSHASHQHVLHTLSHCLHGYHPLLQTCVLLVQPLRLLLHIDKLLLADLTRALGCNVVLFPSEAMLVLGGVRDCGRRAVCATRRRGRGWSDKEVVRLSFHLLRRFGGQPWTLGWVVMVDAGQSGNTHPSAQGAEVRWCLSYFGEGSFQGWSFALHLSRSCRCSGFFLWDGLIKECALWGINRQ